MSDAKKESNAEGFTGRWKYQSYRPESAPLHADTTPPTLVAWSRSGEMIVDESGTKGTLTFPLPTPPGPLVLALTIEYVPGETARLFITAISDRPGGKKFTNELRGWGTLEGTGSGVPSVFRGAIVQTSEDVEFASPKQPPGTTGFFVLERLP